MASAVLLALAVFGACSVEAVEALTLVVASGATTGWRSALEGAGSALVVLGILVAAVGIPLARDVPVDVLRVVIGGLLLVLGLSWLRKAVLRASGHKLLHDEDAIYQGAVSGLAEGAGRSASRRNAAGYAVAFKGVLLEGVEVVLIVISLGTSSHRLGLAVTMAAAAALVVAAVGALVVRQLREVPENSLKLGVGVLLTSFGLFWVGEGTGLGWPGSDAWLLVLVAAFALVTFGLVSAMKGKAVIDDASSTASGLTAVDTRVSTTHSFDRGLVQSIGRALRGLGRFWLDFLVGDAPEIFTGVLVVVAIALAFRDDRLVAIPVLCVLSLLILTASTYRGRTRRPL